MSKSPTSSLEQRFSSLADPRTGQNIQHPLMSIISIAICGVICGADTWMDIVLFGEAKKAWLETFLDLRHGIPSHDTFGRVFRQLEAGSFEQCFREWTQALCQRTAGAIRSLDGKQVRRSKDGALGRDGIWLVSVWAADNHLVLAQEQVAEGSNEIPTLKHLLEVFDFSHSIVTIDGIGCQADIVEAIVGQEADYVIAVKDNQKTLFEDVQAAFEPSLPTYQPTYAKTVEKGHGRLEIRQCWVTDDPEVLSFIQNYKTWTGLRSLVKITSERRLADKTQHDTRYFITSLPPDPHNLLKVVRTHWQIENGLHWILDVAFREDDSRVRKDHAPRNLALIRRLALNLLKADNSLKVGIKAKRLRAGWDTPYLLKILCSS
jgi:predicted transposase YbfD/YdcC